MHVPETTRVSGFPFSNRYNDPHREMTESILTEDDSRTNLSNFLADGEIKIDQPDLTAPGSPFH